jgi:hypothetical protein
VGLPGAGFVQHYCSVVGIKQTTSAVQTFFSSSTFIPAVLQLYYFSLLLARRIPPSLHHFTTKQSNVLQPTNQPTQSKCSSLPSSLLSPSLLPSRLRPAVSTALSASKCCYFTYNVNVRINSFQWKALRRHDQPGPLLDRCPRGPGRRGPARVKD